jgi:alkanesulfonate monooxygenase SsuD/methylene tetrahydromethanopterin reductase-like flavin-dependent oxidoreductase (luciferase family)
MDVGMMLTTARSDHWTATDVFDYSMDFAVEADNLGYQSVWLLDTTSPATGCAPTH